MKPLSVIKRIISTACVCFTVLILVFSFFQSPDDSSLLLSVGRIYQLLVFSLIFGFSGLILMIARLDFYVRLLLHYVACLADFLAVLVFQSGNAGAMRVFAGFIICTVLYLVFALPAAIIHTKAKKRDNKIKDYKSVFDTSTENKKKRK